MKGKGALTIGQKIVVMILVISVTLSAAALLVGWRSYSANTNDLFRKVGENAVNTLAAHLTPEELDHYYETQTPDARYYEVQRLLHTMTDAGQVKYLYVVHINEEGITFLFDSEGGVDSNGECSLGYYQEADGTLASVLDQLRNGEAIEPQIDHSEEYGWLMTAVAPIRYENGILAGYVMADVEMNDVVSREQHFLWMTALLLAGLTGVLLGGCLSITRKRIVGPIQELTAAVEAYEENEDQRALRNLKVREGDEIGTLTTAFKMMVAEIGMNNYFEQEVVVREQALESELDIARELSSALLPKSLPERKEGYPFQVRGILHPEESLAGTFYDYFLDSRDRLCVLVGDAPGEGVSKVLYTAMARAILKSQLRSELPLAEAVAEANRQVHELSDTFSLNVLVGVLDSETGWFSLVNAGGEAPFLLRCGDRYQRMKALSYAPMGQSANVTYQVQKEQLRQGDRLLLFTGGLAGISDGEGRAFAGTRLGSLLNEKENRQGSLEQTLANVSAGGLAFADRPGSVGGYALLALEYSRRNRAQAHLVIRANARGGAALRRFLREQMEANGFNTRRIAEIVVLGDELFSLCCRQAEGDGRFMAECEVPSSRDVVRLRLKGSLGGRDPLLSPVGEASRNGAAFIQRSCEQVLFERGGSADMITVVRRFSDLSHQEG